MPEIIDFLTQRRSVTAKNMTDPGPDDDQLQQILAAGIRVPDHGRLGPWQFIVIKGDARAKFGDVLADAFEKANDDTFDELLEIERERFQRAPVVVAVTSRVVKEHKIPEWEQQLSSGAACMNMLNAAHAMGGIDHIVAFLERLVVVGGFLGHTRPSRPKPAELILCTRSNGPRKTPL